MSLNKPKFKGNPNSYPNPPRIENPTAPLPTVLIAMPSAHESGPLHPESGYQIVGYGFIFLQILNGRPQLFIQVVYPSRGATSLTSR